jgi:transposase
LVGFGVIHGASVLGRTGAHAQEEAGSGTYPTDLIDTQWALIAPLIPEAQPGGRPRKASSRELVNAILHFLRDRMAWQFLPHEFPLWQSVYYYLRRWQREGVWDRVDLASTARLRACRRWRRS